MTIIMTFVGLIAFVISCATVGFKSGLRRLVTCALVGLFIDLCLIGIGAMLFYSTVN